MYSSGEHPTYKHTEADRQLVLEDVGVTAEELKAGGEAIRSWVEKQPHLAEAGIDIRMAQIYIIMSKGSIEKAKQRIDNYYQERNHSPNVQGRIKLLENYDKPIWNTFIMYPAPKLFNGCRITYTVIFDYSATVEEMLVTASMLYDIRFYNDFWCGEIWVFDLNNPSLGDILSLNFAAMSRGFWLFKKVLGMRIKQIIVINCNLSSIVQTLFNFLKTFLGKKVIDRLQFHENDDILKEYLPREYLPRDYGGELPSIVAYKDVMEEMITNGKTKQFLLDNLKLKSDESKRPKSEFNEEQLQGHFKKLDID